uniref:Uncharacterized protein LOC111126571 isoform X3 n=1 Tax=Crassostrea virginica TaxID=6565 RepID=A0A8B8DGH0_CRAVI|nr:uncharacterized protein LOC111126571 isoform X3 [Crassostrea virginica]
MSLCKMYLLIFAACLIVISWAKEVDNTKQAVLLPCYFGAYDTNNDGVINLDEFMDASLGYTKRSPKDIFDRFDINNDNKIVYAEFREAMPGLQKDQVYDHCKKRCWWCSNCCNKRR